MKKIKSSVVNANGINLYYLDSTANENTILCLHGKWGRCETWRDFIHRYKNRFRIIAPDQRGHGLSNKPVSRYAGEDFSRDAYELIKRVNCAPVIVVGHSLGARNAAYLAALYPQAVKLLVLLDTKADGPEKLSDIPPEKILPIDQFTAGWPTPYSSYEEAVNDISKRFEKESNIEYFRESLIETAEGYDFMFSRFAMSAMDIYYQRWYHILDKIECPVLFVRAKESWYLSSEEALKMKEHIKNCTYFEISNSDHMLYADNPNDFYPRFEQFIKEV
ncbi:MAG: alpha/beta hydrolase [Deltaproteobacteria bacterium]|nr:alpha/beta hydrolase [Deltaproteobacteria bacterium]